MTYKKLYEHVLEEFNEKTEYCNQLKKELLEVYKCLYPELGDIIKMQKESLSFLSPEKVNFLVEGAALDVIREQHKEQLEKEKNEKID